MKTVETWLPHFNGFYHTLWGDIIESEENAFIEHYNDEHNLELTYEDFNWEYDEIRNEIVEQIASHVSDMLDEIGIKNEIEVQGIVSPRFYNYTNDSSNIKITFDEEALKNILFEHVDEFAKHIHSKYSSRSGFTSFHSNDYKTWLDELFESDEWDEHKTGEVLEFALSVDKLEGKWDVEREIYESLQDIYLSAEPNFESIGGHVADEYINEVLLNYKTEDETIKAMIDALDFEKGNFENVDRVFLEYAQFNKLNLELQKLFNDYMECLYKAGLEELYYQTDKVNTHQLKG